MAVVTGIYRVTTVMLFAFSRRSNLDVLEGSSRRGA